MSTNATDPSRRRFLRDAVAGVVALPIVGLGASRAAHAQDMPKLSLDDPQAKALDYVHDAGKAQDHSAFQQGSTCANCIQYTGDPQAEWGPCRLFPGKLVNSGGWCKVWGPRG
jgi:hypothetical protein